MGGEIENEFDEHSDWTLTNKLRIEDSEQFHTLVRMHLSFELDLSTDETDGSTEEKTKFRPLKWSFSSFSKKIKNPREIIVEGVSPLTQDIVSQIYQLIEFLSLEENITQEGIFRKSGSTSRQQELKNLLSQGNNIDITKCQQFSVHDCASVLKCYLAELPEPLLTEVYYPAYCQISEFSISSEQTLNIRLLRSIQLLILLLPLENYNLFKKIIHLLNLTSSYDKLNKMSSANLATLFTPHLLCPRKLSPEALHTNAAILSKIVVFMIDNGLDIFQVPDTLATDVKLYWANKERKLKSPPKDPAVNDSIMDSSAVNTVFTFVDREKTAQENTVNATEAALAQLYAYIQSLPESSKKRRLVKQFNKENGYGTPAVVAKQTPVLNSSSKKFGDSIKRHIFSKSIKNSASKANNAPKAKIKINLDHYDMKQHQQQHHHHSDHSHDLIPPTLKEEARTHIQANRQMPDLTRLYEDQWKSDESSDDEFCSPFFATPTRSNRLVETMLTPRSRKPVVALSGTNLCDLADLSNTFQSPLILPNTDDEFKPATVDLSFVNDTDNDYLPGFGGDKNIDFESINNDTSSNINDGTLVFESINEDSGSINKVEGNENFDSINGNIIDIFKKEDGGVSDSISLLSNVSSGSSGSYDVQSSNSITRKRGSNNNESNTEDNVVMKRCMFNVNHASETAL